jgi:hypothetical protein
MQTIEHKELSNMYIITASKDNTDGLAALANSLRLQTRRDFTWVVSIPSTDDTSYSYLNSISDLDVLTIAEPDIGIYSALNQCLLEIPDSGFYIVAGDDDTFSSRTVELFTSCIHNLSRPAIITANVLKGDNLSPSPTYSGLYRKGQMHSISSHVLATCIPVSLHQRYGYYDESLAIAGDEDFLLKCILRHVEFRHLSFTAGQVGCSGISSSFLLQTLSESLLVRARYLNPKVLAFVFSLKLLKGLLRF